MNPNLYEPCGIKLSLENKQKISLFINFLKVFLKFLCIFIFRCQIKNKV